MAIKTYGRLAVFYNGNLLQEVTSIQHVTNGGKQRVDLLNEGLAGYTPGSGDCTIEIGFAVPADGTEDEFQEAAATDVFVTLQIPIGRKDYIGKGWIETCTISQSTSASVEGSFTWIGELKSAE